MGGNLDTEIAPRNSELRAMLRSYSDVRYRQSIRKGGSMENIFFSASQITAIADALGDTDEGLTGSEIGHLLSLATIADADPTGTKRIRLYNALGQDQNKRGNRTGIQKFIRVTMKPERFTRKPERKLAQLDAAQTLEFLRSPPGNRLEALKGERKGQFSIRINDQYRLCFRWTNDGPTDVELVDYH
jgi:proteic killer suppression protein